MVQAAHNGAAFPVIFNNMKLPERFGEVERRAHQVAGHLLQRGFVARRGQRHPVQMGINIERGVWFPISGGKRYARLHHAHEETIKG